jgi:hypothetical protein
MTRRPSCVKRFELDMATSNPLYRCAGPNCGLLKNPKDRWWLMWTAMADGHPILSLGRWDESIALREGALPVCGEQCAQRLQSIFMGNITQGELPKPLKQNGTRAVEP